MSEQNHIIARNITTFHKYQKPHNIDEVHIVHLSEVHWWTEKLSDFVQNFNEHKLGLDPRFDPTNQIFLCWYEEQAREIIKAIENGKWKTGRSAQPASQEKLYNQ